MRDYEGCGAFSEQRTGDTAEQELAGSRMAVAAHYDVAGAEDGSLLKDLVLDVVGNRRLLHQLGVNAVAREVL